MIKRHNLYHTTPLALTAHPDMVGPVKPWPAVFLSPGPGMGMSTIVLIPGPSPALALAPAIPCCVCRVFDFLGMLPPGEGQVDRSRRSSLRRSISLIYACQVRMRSIRQGLPRSTYGRRSLPCGLPKGGSRIPPNRTADATGPLGHLLAYYDIIRLSKTDLFFPLSSLGPPPH